ncbi:hypothetical protein B0G38_000359 [Arthrobacter sp. VKM Ac-2550]|nr:hypothetical protein [Arthrobacter sp. VKM Ac-2550]
MSPATIDRRLKPAKDARYPQAVSATAPGSTLRSSLQVRQAMDEMEQESSFFEIDLVAHCGHRLKGEHAWTLTATDIFTGWTENIAIRNRAHKWVVAALSTTAPRPNAADSLPSPIRSWRSWLLTINTGTSLGRQTHHVLRLPAGNPVTASIVGIMFSRIWAQVGLPRPLKASNRRPMHFAITSPMRTSNGGWPKALTSTPCCPT